MPAVARAARLLDTLAVAKEPMPLSALAKALELPKSTVHGLCATLVDAGLITRFENGAYHLGVRIMDLAHAYLARTDLTVEFAKILNAEAPLPEEWLQAVLVERIECLGRHPELESGRCNSINGRRTSQSDAEG